MSRPSRLEPTVAALLRTHDHDGSPEALIHNLVSDLLVQIYGRPPTIDDLPVDINVAAGFWGASIEIKDTDVAGSIRWTGDRFVITLPSSDAPTRRRFSGGHEIIHIPFMRASNGMTHVDNTTGEFDHGRLEEYLCDLGAATLLMPESAIREEMPAAPTMTDVLWLAQQCGTSIEATARRVVDLAAIPGSVVVLQPNLKPAEWRRVIHDRHAPAIPGLEQPLPKPRLRVHWSVDRGVGKIWPHKSVDDSSPLAQVFDREIDFEGETGLLPGKHVVSARYLPYQRGSERVERVVAIMFDARAWQAAAAA